MLPTFTIEFDEYSFLIEKNGLYFMSSERTVDENSLQNLIIFMRRLSEDNFIVFEESDETLSQYPLKDYS